MNSKWHIGQKVVALINTPKGLVKGEVYTIDTLRDGICNCAKVLIGVEGINGEYIGINCPYCGRVKYELTKPVFYERFFKPLDDICVEALDELMQELEQEFDNNKTVVCHAR